MGQIYAEGYDFGWTATLVSLSPEHFLSVPPAVFHVRSNRPTSVNWPAGGFPETDSDFDSSADLSSCIRLHG